MRQKLIGISAIIGAGILAARLGHAGPAGNSGTGISWDKPSENVPAAASGIRWEKSFAAAKARAAKERKPILLLHLFGRLDEGLC